MGAGDVSAAVETGRNGVSGGQEEAGAGCGKRGSETRRCRPALARVRPWVTEALPRRFQAEAVWLDQIFNFAPLLIASNVLPPVITEARSAAHEFSRDKMETAGRFTAFTRLRG